MPTERSTYRKHLHGKIKDRKIVWVGSRGCDAIPLTDFKNPIVSICYGSPAQHEAITEHTYEEMMHQRVNPYTYEASSDTSDGIKELRRILIKELEEPCCLIPYKPMSFIDTAYFLHHKHTKMLGLFSELQQTFNHKTWIETALHDAGIRTIPWTYLEINESSKQEIFRATMEAPIMLRVHAASAGSGLIRIDSKETFEAAWEWLTQNKAPLIAYSPYFSGASSLAASATVFSDGRVALHPLSLQCIGVPELTPHNAGYSGNDFGMIRDLPASTINHLEAMVRDVGQWLASRGFIGAFGIDALLHEEQLYFIEANPRFLGSSKMCSSIDRALDRPDVYMTHMASFLELPPPPQVPLRELIVMQPQLGQMIFHNTQPHFVTVKKKPVEYEKLPFGVTQTPEASVSVAPGGPISTLNWNEPLLRTNGTLNETGQFIADTFLESITIYPQGLSPERPKRIIK
ncbi:ATP-grasp domain-containing protein [Halodesulfovibrio marinisediminis]|uniref:ATP-grasp domain-containing protein n=1 Tax=Halodesulfovibrio marinisediminis DSM 17456 TaxID=1121457 RepID=A0A1N6GVB4_9BACT|nr:ATP-grasp domain-containing protein [Halodesulfovibrio marinisediminis]SIO11500.1 ATP-grasp domain-containing protein [Halodesulfovibrio marinisediminis DSM 17456]